MLSMGSLAWPHPMTISKDSWPLPHVKNTLSQLITKGSTGGEVQLTVQERARVMS